MLAVPTSKHVMGSEILKMPGRSCPQLSPAPWRTARASKGLNASELASPSKRHFPPTPPAPQRHPGMTPWGSVGVQKSTPCEKPPAGNLRPRRQVLGSRVALMLGGSVPAHRRVPDAQPGQLSAGRACSPGPVEAASVYPVSTQTHCRQRGPGRRQLGKASTKEPAGAFPVSGPRAKGKPWLVTPFPPGQVGLRPRDPGLSLGPLSQV